MNRVLGIVTAYVANASPQLRSAVVRTAFKASVEFNRSVDGFVSGANPL
jgi:hypothetical protein